MPGPLLVHAFCSPLAFSPPRGEILTMPVSWIRAVSGYKTHPLLPNGTDQLESGLKTGDYKNMWVSE